MKMINDIMKRFLITVLALAFAALPAMAQHEDAVKIASDTTRVSLEKDMVRDLGSEDDILTVSFRNNTHWFVDALAGGGFYCAEQNRFSQSFITRTRPQAMIGVGKWFHPALAFRLTASTGSFTADYLPITVWNMYEPVDHNKIPEEALPYYVTDEVGLHWFHRDFRYVAFGVDLMYDLTRAFSMRMETPYDLYFYGGPGVSVSMPGQGFASNTSLSFRLGGQMDIHITDRLGLKFQLEGTIVDESLDGQIDGTTSTFNRTLEGYATAMVGISYRWGHKVPTTYVKSTPVVLERTYNMLPVVVKQMEETEFEEFKAPFVVRFFIDQYNIEPDQELNITKVCTYLESHPSARLLMTGHCDPETANPKYNQALSERRCRSVMKYIDEHFKIDHSRIDVQPMGDTQRNFDEDFRWNRCVILTIIDE